MSYCPAGTGGSDTVTESPARAARSQSWRPADQATPQQLACASTGAVDESTVSDSASARTTSSAAAGVAGTASRAAPSRSTASIRGARITTRSGGAGRCRARTGRAT